MDNATFRILIVDDDDTDRTALQRPLIKAGYRIKEACDGKEALRIYKTFAPDLVITDLVMPNQEGIETVKKLLLQQPDLPIITVSGSDFIDFLSLTEEMGATRSFTKPIEEQTLLDTVQELLGAT